MIERRRRPGEERLWPVPPGHPSHYYAQAAAGEEEEEGVFGMADPGRWSLASQDGSSSVPETGPGVGRGHMANARSEVGRAF